MKTGLEKLLENPKPLLGSARVGLVANPTTITPDFKHAVDTMHANPEIKLSLLLGPEHGVRSTAQDMVGVGDARDPRTGLPEVSLYGSTFESLSPTDEHLAQIDTLVFDIQDVGSRYYTYAATMALCMQVCGKHQVKVVVLDRPNPIGSAMEGGGLTPGLENFCALYPIPQRHGLTVGELARLYRGAFDVTCELEVVPMDAWNRTDYYDSLGLPWVMPSPNMPTLDSAIVYPGMCLLEGTEVSEGRGTTRPFELFGAPYIDGYALHDTLTKLNLEGVSFRVAAFEPTFQKYARIPCQGLQLHVQDRQAFNAYRTGLAVVWAIKNLYPDQFKWRTDTYEFRDDVPAIDLLTGFASVREAIDQGASFDSVYEDACQGLEVYQTNREACLLY